MGSEIKRLKTLNTLVFIACILHGLLAGENTYRYSMEVPAWRHLDITNWLQYSRHADLGNGVFLFPVEAIAGLILIAIASLIVVKYKTLFRHLAPLIYTTTVFAALGIVFTFFAAPYMLSLRTGDKTPAELQHVFDQFHFWGGWRAMMQIAAFIANIFALAKVYSINSINK